VEHEAGPLAFFGDLRDSPPGTIERELVGYAGGEVAVLPTGAAYERPLAVIDRLQIRYEAIGARIEPMMVLSRRDAENAEISERLRAARLVLVVGGSPLHLRSVLKDSAVLAALVASWHDGGAVAGVGAGATVLSDPMVDPRGGAFTVGLGLVRDLSVVPGFTGEMTPGLRRTLALAPSGCAVVALGGAGALVRDSDGTWRQEGDDAVAIYTDTAPAGLETLAGKPIW
jgi:cyanophycinase